MTAADVVSGARCQLACWRETYAGMVPAAALDRATSDEADRIARWRGFLDYEPARWVAVTGEEVVGFAATGASRNVSLDLIELYAIYVRRAHWGTGVGQRLINTALGDADAVLWVLRDNERARAFYTRNGFRPDGTEAMEEKFEAVEIRMVRHR